MASWPARSLNSRPAPGRSRWPPPSRVGSKTAACCSLKREPAPGKRWRTSLPAILGRQRVLVSTGTKNLQEQIYFKDIPALREALGVPFTATCMKGRANYLCLHRLDQLDDDSGADAPATDVFLPIIREWSARTETGDRAELADLPEDVPVWNEVSATAETCLGTDCPQYDECFVTRMRQRAASSDVVIVNHHLLCADAAVRQSAFGEVIPACANAIVDEAHQLEDVATQYFGYSVSNYRVEDWRVTLNAWQPPVRLRQRIHFSDDQSGRTPPRHGKELFCRPGLCHRSSERRGEERVRVTSSSLAQTSDSAADLTGALDVVEAALAGAGSIRQKADPTDDESDDASRETLATLVRRVGRAAG